MPTHLIVNGKQTAVCSKLIAQRLPRKPDNDRTHVSDFSDDVDPASRPELDEGARARILAAREHAERKVSR